MRREVILLITLLASSTILSFVYIRSENMYKRSNVVLIIWDATQRDEVYRLIKNDLPTLCSLVKDGSLVNLTYSDENARTETLPGHTQIFTGYNSDVTGIRANSDGGKKVISKGYTIFERIKYFDKNITTIYINDCLGVKDNWPLSNAKNSIDVYYYVTQTGRWVEPTTEVALKEIDNINPNNQFLLVIRFEEPTHFGYWYGGESENYSQSIKICDKYTGEIIKRLKERSLYENTVIFITSDHGYNQPGHNHQNCPDVILGSNLCNLPKNGYLTQVAPTILKNMGIDISRIEPQMDKPLSEQKLPYIPYFLMGPCIALILIVTIVEIRRSIIQWFWNSKKKGKIGRHDRLTMGNL